MNLKLGPALVLSWILLGSSALAQDIGDAGRTLRGWEERVFFKIIDRDGNIFGADWGTLQLFHPDQDEEYRLDERTNSFSLLSDFRWYRQDEGLRLWVGSLNNPMLYVVSEIRKRIALAKDFDIHFSYHREESFEANRNLILIRFEKGPLGGKPLALFLTFHTRATKASIDLEVGGRYRGERGTWTVSGIFLDLFNDLTAALDRSQDSRRDREKDFIDHPYLLRVNGEIYLSDPLRAELYAGIGTRSLFEVVHPDEPARDFRQSEQASYFGGLLEWRPHPVLAGGVLATLERAEQEREPIGSMAADLSLKEKALRAGVYLIANLPSLALEGTLDRIWRPEKGQDPGALDRDLDHRDSETLAGLEATISLIDRLDLILGYFYDHRKASEDLVDLSGTNNRLKLRLQYRFTEITALTVGANMDLDHGGRRLFDGGNAVLVALW